MSTDESRATATVASPVGPLAITSDGRSIVRVEWIRELPGEVAPANEGSTTEAAAAAGVPTSEPAAESRGSVSDDPADPLLSRALDQMRAYFDGSLHEFTLPVDFGKVSEVARTVLKTLADSVAHGETLTYGQLADRSGTGIPARAVGGIMGLNPIPIIVPCHRVVAGDGLGGYSGGRPGHGLATKRWLLEWEDALPRPLF